MRHFMVPVVGLFMVSTAMAGVVAPAAAPALFNALVNAGATPRGFTSFSSAVMVHNVNCSAGYNQFMHKAEANCSFIDGTAEIKVQGRRASTLTEALVQAKLITKGPAEMTAGSVRQINCTAQKAGNATQFSCAANK